MKYEFTAKVWNYSSTVGTGGWHIACNTQWETAIWFDTKLDTYLLPLKAEIRKKEKITTDKEIEIMIWI